MSDPTVRSWGRFPRADQASVWQRWRFDEVPLIPEGQTLLPHGLGRSYGDSCLNDGNAVLRTRLLRHFISFDPQTGVLRAESGVSLSEIIDLCLPLGWFLPVTPGTRFVTLGGAIANDVHGKNHHRAGTFGHAVRGFELVRSDGSRRWCSPEENPEWFRATVGGLGLTGLITWAEVQMHPALNGMISMESIRYDSLDEFLQLSLDSERDFDYVVAWVDCLAGGRSAGRGILMRGNHSQSGPAGFVPQGTGMLRCPVDFPDFAINHLTVGAFNTVYYGKHGAGRKQTEVSIYPFFYPLDAVDQWNRIYGPRGFVQWQCLVPVEHGVEPFREILDRISKQGSASFLAVMKLMGDAPNAGNLSFNGRGFTLALDFPASPVVFGLLDQLDDLVLAAGGTLYAAKDARMKPETYQTMYPLWREHQRWIDPQFSSSFWRRVTRS
ncbi:MAG: FAD-binding oxidoreductase [Bryobacteraceae bacterium]|nr:FAD-binding oxidoreductase [Bryobacteraceae bacterium]